MVNDPNRPVQFVFAGKAHPKDDPGKGVLQQIAELTRDSKVGERFVFVEDYDINVARYLQKQGIEPTKLSAAAFGEFKTVADNATAEGRAKNRRIEIVLVPKE